MRYRLSLLAGIAGGLALLTSIIALNGAQAQARGTNFAQLAECGVHFSPQTLSVADQKNVLGSLISQKFKKAEAALCHRGKLQCTGIARQLWKDGGK